jgi:hypothetical protein
VSKRKFPFRITRSINLWITIVLLGLVGLGMIFNRYVEAFSELVFVTWVCGFLIFRVVRNAISETRRQAALQAGMRWQLMQQHIQSQTCPQCLYSLIGNESGVCPECGSNFRADTLRYRIEYLRKSARAGDAMAMYNLAVLIQQGGATGIDEGEPVRLINHAARLGYKPAVDHPAFSHPAFSQTEK